MFGFVPVHTAGVEAQTLVCKLLTQGPQSPHVQVQGGVQACDVTGVPVHPAGEVEVTVLVCVPAAEQVPQAL